MATSWGEAAARGIESGFGLGLRADQAAEDKRARAVQEQRQAGADLRSEQELDLRRDAEARQERRLGDAERRDVQGRATTALEGRRKELLAAGQAAGVSGAPVPAGLQEEYGQVSARLAALRQQALDDASRLASGQVSLDSMAPAQLFRTVTLGSGMAPKDLQAMPQHAADLQAGMSTGNNGLVLQSVNGLLAPALRVGVGTPSPYGGTISRKEIIGLDPAQDANGVDHPGKVIPRLRVYVQRPGEAGERYYDAPMTMDRSGNPDDKVAAIDIRKALDWVGNLGTLTTALQRPDLQEKLAQGEREAGPEVQKYFDEFNLAIKPGKKSVTHETVDLGGYLLDRERGPDGSLVSERRLEKTAVPKDRTSVGEDLKQRLSLLDSERASGRIDDAEYKQRRADLISGIKSRPRAEAGDAGGLTPEAIEMTAEAALKDRMALANIGRGNQGAKDLRAVMNKMAEKVKEGGGGGGMVDRRATFAADKKSLDKLIPQFDAIEAFTNNTVAQGEALKGLATKVDTTGVPVVERWIRAGRKNLKGDTDVTDFNAQLTLYRNEAARILTNPNLTGVLTVDAMKEMRALMANEASAEQIVSAVNLLERDFARRRKSLVGQVEEIRHRMQHGTAPSEVTHQPANLGPGLGTTASRQPAEITNDADYNALPSGTEFIAPDGSRRRKP
jgi:hypothetical protein